MNTTIVKLFKRNYSSQVMPIFGVVAIIFGVLVVLSTSNIIPKFPLTENMSSTNGLLFFLGTLVGGIFLIRIPFNTVKKYNHIYSQNIKTVATVKKVHKDRKSIGVTYEYTYENKTYKDTAIFVRKDEFLKKFAVDSKHDIFLDVTGKKVTGLLAYYGE